MKYWWWICGMALLFSCKGKDPESIPAPLSTPKEQSIQLSFSGDLMQHMPQVHAAKRDDGKYDYTTCFSEISPYWKQSDFTIVNLETTLAENNFSGYPRFRSPHHLVEAAKKAGVTVFVTANNHTCDQGKTGIEQTIHWLNQYHTLHTGAYADTTQYIKQFPLLLKKNGFRIAILNYTYGTNGLPIPEGTIIPLIDTTFIRQEINSIQQYCPTHIVAFMHWGEEYQQRANSNQKKLAKWLHQQGIDIVIGSHPHVIQPYEYHITGQDTTGVTIYSLGNLISNQREPERATGLTIQLKLTIGIKGVKSYQITPIIHQTVIEEKDGFHSYIIRPML